MANFNGGMPSQQWWAQHPQRDGQPFTIWSPSHQHPPMLMAPPPSFPYQWPQGWYPQSAIQPGSQWFAPPPPQAPPESVPTKPVLPNMPPKPLSPLQPAETPENSWAPQDGCGPPPSTPPRAPENAPGWWYEESDQDSDMLTTSDELDTQCDGHGKTYAQRELYSEALRNGMNTLNRQLHDDWGVSLLDSDTDAIKLKSKNKSPASASKTLVVYGLPPWMSQSRLKAKFSRFGHIISARVTLGDTGFSPASGFIEFATVDAAERALAAKDGALVEGWDMSVKFYGAKGHTTGGSKDNSNRDTTKSKAKASAGAKTLVISNFSPDVTSDMLEHKFSQYGPIVNAFFTSSDNSSCRYTMPHGYIEYANADIAAKALEATDGSYMDGRQLIVQFSHNLDIGEMNTNTARVKKKSTPIQLHTSWDSPSMIDLDTCSTWPTPPTTTIEASASATEGNIGVYHADDPHEVVQAIPLQCVQTPETLRQAIFDTFYEQDKQCTLQIYDENWTMINFQKYWPKGLKPGAVFRVSFHKTVQVHVRAETSITSRFDGLPKFRVPGCHCETSIFDLRRRILHCAKFEMDGYPLPSKYLNMGVGRWAVANMVDEKTIGDYLASAYGPGSQSLDVSIWFSNEAKETKKLPDPAAGRWKVTLSEKENEASGCEWKLATTSDEMEN